MIVGGREAEWVGVGLGVAGWVYMNNKWLVWWIRRGQASVGEADMLLCVVSYGCQRSEGRMQTGFLHRL